MALSSKAKDGSLIVVDRSRCQGRQDQGAGRSARKLGFGKTALVIDGDA
jgi:large subunit ribosomal protein L4